MSEREAVLFANEAFYAAFVSRDIAAMENVWSEGDIMCLHPGWPPLQGREAVIGSWRNILGNAASPAIEAHMASAAIYGAVGIVTCIEVIDAHGKRPQTLCATNIFVKDKGHWRLVHHHGGQANIDLKVLADEEKQPMN